MSILEQGSSLDKAKPDANLTDFDRRVFDSMAKALWLPNEFKEYMVQYLALNQPPLSVSNLFGFKQFTVQSATRIATSESTTSTTFTNLTTTGPELTGLPDGEYLVLFGALLSCSGGGYGYAGVTVNGTTAVGFDPVQSAAATFVNIAGALVKTLDTGGSNTLLLQYRADAGTTATFAGRWMIIIRSANV